MCHAPPIARVSQSFYGFFTATRARAPSRVKAHFLHRRGETEGNSSRIRASPRRFPMNFDEFVAAPATARKMDYIAFYRLQFSSFPFLFTRAIIRFTAECTETCHTRECRRCNRYYLRARSCPLRDGESSYTLQPLYSSLRA